MGRNLNALDIAPIWLESLRRHKAAIEPLSIDSDKYCIVGETWGFTRHYVTECEECYRSSIEFSFCVAGSTFRSKHNNKRFEIADLEMYKQTFKEFLEHFNSVHKAEWYASHGKP